MAKILYRTESSRDVGLSWMRTRKGAFRTDPALSDQSLSPHNGLKVPTAHMGGLPRSSQDPACEFVIDGRGCCFKSSWMAKRKWDLDSSHHLVSILTLVLQDKGDRNITASFWSGRAISLRGINRKYFLINTKWLISFSEGTVSQSATQSPRKGDKQHTTEGRVKELILAFSRYWLQAVTLCRSLNILHTPQHWVMNIRIIWATCYVLTSLTEK